MAQWIGFDYGKRYIGTAIGSTHTLVASALQTTPARKGVPDWAAIDKLVEAWQPAGFVLGYPLNMDGTTQKISHYVRIFQKNLIHRYQKPCYLVDERLTTHHARQQCQDSGNKAQLNATAATIILQHWFDEGMPCENHFTE